MDSSGGVKARLELDYSTFMTQLIESSSTVHSPGASDKEDQPVHKKVHEHFIP